MIPLWGRFLRELEPFVNAMYRMYRNCSGNVIVLTFPTLTASKILVAGLIFMISPCSKDLGLLLYHFKSIKFIGLTASSRRSTFLPILLTFWDAQNQPNKCNPFAKGFPIDDIQTWKYDINGPVCPCFLTGIINSLWQGYPSLTHSYQNWLHTLRFWEFCKCTFVTKVARTWHSQS